MARSFVRYLFPLVALSLISWTAASFLPIGPTTFPFPHHGAPHDHHHDDDDHHDHAKRQGTTLECFTLVCFAALAHVLGALLPFIDGLFAMIGSNVRILNSPTFLSGSLSFSAGVMIFGSLAVIYGEAIESLEDASHTNAPMLACCFFFAGVLALLVIDIVVDKLDSQGILHNHNIPQLQHTDDEMVTEEPEKINPHHQKRLLRIGLQTLMAMFIHNIPEGIVTYTAAKNDFRLGALIGLAIVLHNIPEGMAAVTPLYYATGSRWKAFLLAGGGSIATPIGGVIAWSFMKDSLSPFTAGAIEAFTGGIMSFISFHGLLPSARAFDPKDKVTTLLLFVGMAVMGVSVGFLEITGAE